MQSESSELTGEKLRHGDLRCALLIMEEKTHNIKGGRSLMAGLKLNKRDRGLGKRDRRKLVTIIRLSVVGLIHFFRKTENHGTLIIREEKNSEGH